VGNVNVSESKNQAWACREHSGLLRVQFGQQGFKGVGNFIGIGPFKNNLLTIWAAPADDSRELRETAECTEGVLGTFVDAMELQRLHSLCIGGHQFEGIDQHSAVLTKSNACCFWLALVPEIQNPSGSGGAAP